MIDWEHSYRARSDLLPWESGRPAPCVQTLELQPCRVLSIGCGSGVDETCLAEKGFDVTAVDISETAIEIARGRNANVQWIVGDIMDMNLGEFDFVFDRCCYHHLRYEVDYAVMLKRHTKPGSTCLILSHKKSDPPGVEEEHMRDDFKSGFVITSLESNALESRFGEPHASWALHLMRT